MDTKAELIQALTEMKTAMTNCAEAVNSDPEAVRETLKILPTAVDEIIGGLEKYRLVLLSAVSS